MGNVVRVAGRMGVKLVNVTTLTVLVFNVGCLGKVGVFRSTGCCCMRCAGVGKLTKSDPIFTGNCGMNAMEGVGCGCTGPKRIAMRIRISGRVHVPGKDAKRLIARVLKAMGVGLLLGFGSARCCRPKSALPNGAGTKLVKTTRRGLIPRVRRVLPGVSSVLCSLGGVLTSPTLDTALRGTRGLATGLSIAAHRLGVLVRGSLPRLAKGLGAVTSGFVTVDSGLGNVSCTSAFGGVSSALCGMRVLARGLGHGSGDVKLLFGSPAFCRGLDTAATGTTALLRSLGTRPGHCMRFSLFNGGSGWRVYWFGGVLGGSARPFFRLFSMGSYG